MKSYTLLEQELLLLNGHVARVGKERATLEEQIQALMQSKDTKKLFSLKKDQEKKEEELVQLQVMIVSFLQK
jgi:hypothetical protein